MYPRLSPTDSARPDGIWGVIAFPFCPRCIPSVPGVFRLSSQNCRQKKKKKKKKKEREREREREKERERERK